MNDRGAGQVENDFSGDADAVVQAAAVHGGVHFHAATPVSFPPPRQLPGGTAKFVGREDSLTKLSGLLDALPRGEEQDHPAAVVIAVVTGAPGVGKTALAAHWAHQVVSRFPDGSLYIDMCGYGSEPPLTEGQALDTFLRSLSIGPERIPEGLDERSALYRSIVADKKLLVLIDNVASVRQVRNLLPGSRRCLVLVTTRGSLASLVAREGATRVTLDVLPPEDAVLLLAGIVGEDRVEREEEAARRIAELCGYLPLALRVVAERVAGQPYAFLAETLQELVSEQRRLDALASEEDPLTDVRAVFSWSYRALPGELQRLFRSLGLHPGAEFSSSAAAALVNKPVAAVDSQLQQLAHGHLIQEVTARRYRSHDLLRAYSTERGQHEDAQRERTYAVRRMITWYLLAADNARKVILPYSQSLALATPADFSIPSFGDVASATSWFEQERLNILAELQQAMDLGQFDLAWKLSAVSDGFFEVQSYWAEWRDMHGLALLAAQTIGDSLGEASIRRCLGDVCWRSRDYERALEHYERGAALAGRLQDPWIQGFCLRGTALIRQEQDQTALAAESFERARKVFTAAGLARGAGMSVLSIGKCYRAAGDLERAAEYGESAAATFREIADRWSLAWSLVPLGEANLELGRLDVARSRLAEAVAIFREFADIRSEALALRPLGQAYLDGGDVTRAAGSWTRTLEILEELGDPGADDVRALLGGITDPE